MIIDQFLKNINENIFKIILNEILIIMTKNNEWITPLDVTTMLEYMIVLKRHIWAQQCSVFTTEYTDNVINMKSRKFVINDIFISQMDWDFFCYEYIKRLDLRKSQLQHQNYGEVFLFLFYIPWNWFNIHVIVQTVHVVLKLSACYVCIVLS